AVSRKASRRERSGVGTRGDAASGAGAPGRDTPPGGSDASGLHSPSNLPFLPLNLGSGCEDAERMATFRKQRLAFFQGMQIFSSDEARVVASAEAFYTSTFEHA